MIRIENIEECLDGVSIKELILDQVMTEEAILKLGKRGKLEYFRHFARPFFRITLADGDQFKGVQGSHSIQILFKRYRPEDVQRITRLLETIPSGDQSD